MGLKNFLNYNCIHGKEGGNAINLSSCGRLARAGMVYGSDLRFTSGMGRRGREIIPNPVVRAALRGLGDNRFSTS